METVRDMVNTYHAFRVTSFDNDGRLTGFVERVDGIRMVVLEPLLAVVWGLGCALKSGRACSPGDCYLRKIFFSADRAHELRRLQQMSRRRLRCPVGEFRQRFERRRDSRTMRESRQR